ncbi:hypothetical protein [Thiocapsa marina]|uniref:Uncharacterized protein n=1 Tax=Thiocapsa marina 5811 TaxID=768671 RepID=F9UGB6_9GAMM|nr:hypothetical protein [Thiocapsa marina]EGV16842.1 hypothetical protein ThimaDRAFT_3969 [Thiocapsa marina 5811]
MRKPGISTPTSGRKSSPPRNRPLRNPQAESPDAPPQTALKRTKKAHFLEPYRLSESARAALLACLGDHAVGDPESRELFAAAVEYGIASCRAPSTKTRVNEKPAIAAEQKIRPAEKPAAGPSASPAAEPTSNPSASLAALAETARRLVRGLGALDDRSREAIGNRLRNSDPFDRAHGQAYLDAVRREVERIAEAAAALDTPSASSISPPASSSDPTPAPAAAAQAEDPIEETAHRLVRRVADAYEACFETKAETGAGYPFIPVLRLIAEDAGIALPAADAPLLEILPAHCRT